MSSGRDDESSDSDHRNKRRKTNQMRQPGQNGTPNSTSAGAPLSNPNSFAAKMMAKMGYVEGQGLGASGRGRLAPIETQLRPQGMGLGGVKEKTKQAKEEEKREAAFRGEALEDSSEEEKKRKRRLKDKRKSGATGGSSTPAAISKPKYRTAAEIEASAEGLEIPNVLKSIIDATGNETKVLTSVAGLMATQLNLVPSETEAMKLSRIAQRESVAFADEWRGLQERKEFFDLQEAELRTTMGRQEDEDRALDQLITAIEDLEHNEAGKGTDSSNWERVISKLESMDHHLGDQDNVFDLQEIVVAAICPLFKPAMQEWEPLDDPEGVSGYLKRLQDVLGVNPTSKSLEIALQNGTTFTKPQKKSTSYYETLIYTLWLPPVRSAITKWDVYDPSQPLALIEAWKPILPTFIMANVIDHLVVHRLAEAVAAWKPRRSGSGSTRSLSPHTWLFPWLQYLDEQHTETKSSTGLMSDVKRKLKNVLSTWDLGSGVLPGLENWQTIFKHELPSMLFRYLLPRLAEYLSVNFDVDPADQQMRPLERTLQWTPYFSITTIAQLFTDVFFKKWHHILHLWLVNNPDYSEIMQWYQWWKQQLEQRLPQGFNEISTIASEWESGLNMINVAVDAFEQGLDVATQIQAFVTEHDVVEVEQVPEIEAPITKAVETPTTFKDVVEEWCAEFGLLMFPLREADLQTGLPLFRITASATGRGGAVLYLKGDVVWVRGATSAGMQKNTFVPMGLDDALAARAEGK